MRAAWCRGFKATTICFDELNGVGDQLKRASLNALVCFPFLLVQGPDDRNASAFMKIFFCDFSEFVKTGDLDPVGLFL